MALIDPPVRVGTWAAGSDAPGKTELKIGFIPSTDCASVVMASTLGLDKKYGIKITPSKEASWADVCDKLMSGGLDAARTLYDLIYSVQLGIDSPKEDMAALMMLNNNDQTITPPSKLKEADVKNGVSLKAVMAKNKHEYVFAQTFPTDTHAMWLHYWLAAHGARPPQDTKAITMPPPQVVTDMWVDNMDNYRVSEPWGIRVITNNIGSTAETIRAIWKDHPERVLDTMTEFVQKYLNTMRVLTVAVLEASKFIDASTSNRRRTVKTIAAKPYVSIGVDIILDRMFNRYTNGLDKTWGDPGPVRFYHNGVVNLPCLSDGMWFLTRYKHWGLLKARPDYLAMVKQVNRINVFKQAATAAGTPLPKSDMHAAKSIDGMVQDVENPAAYVDGFELKV